MFGPLKTQMVESTGHPPLFSEQGFLGTQILPSPWYSGLQTQVTFDPCEEHWALTSQSLAEHIPEQENEDLTTNFVLSSNKHCCSLKLKLKYIIKNEIKIGHVTIYIQIVYPL